MVENVIKIMLVIDAAVLAIVVLMQSDRVPDSNLFVNNKNLTLFTASKQRGTDAILFKVTIVTGITLFAGTCALMIINNL